MKNFQFSALFHPCVPVKTAFSLLLGIYFCQNKIQIGIFEGIFQPQPNENERTGYIFGHNSVSPVLWAKISGLNLFL